MNCRGKSLFWRLPPVSGGNNVNDSAILPGHRILNSESHISDTDVAVEMTEFIRNQILSQSATAMLAQAKSLTQMLAGLLES